MQKFKLYSIFILTVSLFGCFPEDNNYQPKPVEGFVGEVDQSIYDQQTFYSLNQNLSIANNYNYAWDIGFKSQPEGDHLILNSADLLSVANLGPVGFDIAELKDDIMWTYDASSGNLDSLAIMGWVNTETSPNTYSQNIYVIRKVDQPFKKFKIIELTETSYTIIISPLDSFDPDTIEIEKDNTINYTKLSIQNDNKIVEIEPTVTEWDFQLTTYQTIIPDDDGVLTPYLVRGVLSNPYETLVGEFYITEELVPNREADEKDIEESELENFFIRLTEDDVEETELTKTLDAIGYLWKKPDIDFESGSAIYKVDLRRVYIIEDQFGGKYKVRFISFYTGGIKGFPKFQYIKLN